MDVQKQRAHGVEVERGPFDRKNALMEMSDAGLQAYISFLVSSLNEAIRESRRRNQK